MDPTAAPTGVFGVALALLLLPDAEMNSGSKWATASSVESFPGVQLLALQMACATTQSQSESTSASPSASQSPDVPGVVAGFGASFGTSSHGVDVSKHV